uniref:2b protein n=1 Tax=Parietaria mottle virus TaxID=64958 RepID=A0A0K2FRQ3_9BROM|nr:2b protein [Parietaria mottle virus]
MMFIPILLLAMSLGLNADVMQPDLVPPTLHGKMPRPDPLMSGVGRGNAIQDDVLLGERESVKVTAASATEQIPIELALEERSPPGKEGSKCIDCAVDYLPEVAFSVKVPKLNINFEVKDFPSSKLIFANLAKKIRSIPFVKSLSVSNDLQRMQLKSLGNVDVYIEIPKFGWNQVLKLSDVVAGFNIPKIPSIAPKLESCEGGCSTT